MAALPTDPPTAPRPAGRPRPAALADVDAAVWRELQRATADRHHAWRTPVLATVDGSMPDARTVVLREVDPEARRLAFYTDVRSAKVDQLRRMPSAMLAMWSQALGWQLRCRVVATVHAGGLAASSRWARVRLTPGAQDYLSPMPPGSALPEPAAAGPPEARVAVPDGPLRTDPVALGHFAVVEVDVVSWDWLELHPQGHRRARFEPRGARWLQP